MSLRPLRVLLVTPPMVQFNTPYAATPLLTAFLRREGVDAHQADLSLELALRLFSRRGLEEVHGEIRRLCRPRTATVRAFLDQAARYVDTVDDAIRFLQRGEPALGRRIRHGLLPRGPRFAVLDDLAAAGIDPGSDGPELQARFLASLYLDDLADVVRDGVDPRFGLSRYAERLTASAPSFAPLARALRRPPGLVDRLLDELVDAALRSVRPDIVGVTIPFPGNVYAAFRIARRARAWNPRVRTIAGGGFVNTELRAISDPRVFESFDFIAYDDGEQPLRQLVRFIRGEAPREALVRTRLRAGRTVESVDAGGPPLRHRDRPAPSYSGLPLGRYCGVVETLNPMSRLWTERRWMKLALAHGCYWHRCAFCDTELDYIARFDPADADTIVDWIVAVRRETGESGFHFVDEAAPPALLRRLAERLLARRVRITWWTNIRFERSFTPGLARLLARAGCIAVTGGLECAEGRLLEAMGKGVTPPQAARVMRGFADAGILVHAYLMYGFPRQTAQETADALELVRQLFRAGCLQSAYWHRFALTVHSAVFRDPGRFGVRVRGGGSGRFAENEVAFTDGRAVDHDGMGRGLHRAVYNYMHGLGLDEDVRAWLGPRAPAPRIRPAAVADWIRRPRRRSER